MKEVLQIAYLRHLQDFYLFESVKDGIIIRQKLKCQRIPAVPGFLCFLCIPAVPGFSFVGMHPDLAEFSRRDDFRRPNASCFDRIFFQG